MSQNNGLNIITDEGFENLANPKGGAVEVDTTDTTDIINPKTIATQAAEAAVDNEEDDNPLLDINEDDEEEEEEIEVEKKEPEPKKKESKKEDEEEYETFKVLGKHFSDEGLLVGYEEDMENSPAVLETMINKTVEKKIEDYKNSFANPLAKDFLEFIENGGQPSDFISLVSGPDYSTLTAESLSDDVEIQRQLVRNQLAANGEEAEDIEEMIEAFEDAGQLEKQSVKALSKLQKAQEKARVEAVEKQKKDSIARKEQNQKVLEELKTKIDSVEELGGFTLSKKEKGDFYDYITKVNQSTGKTGLMADSADPQNQLLMSYLYFKKFDFKKVEKKAKSESTKSLEAKLGRYSDNSVKNKTAKRTAAPRTESSQLNLGPMKKLFG